MLKDGLTFTDGETKVIFNQYSFCELIKHIIVKYAGKTYDEASVLVNNSFLARQVESFSHVTFFTHELEYHWAMIVAHGDMYWLKGIPSNFNKFADSYFEWEDEIMRKHDIKESYKFFDNK